MELVHTCIHRHGFHEPRYAPKKNTFLDCCEASPKERPPRRRSFSGYYSHSFQESIDKDECGSALTKNSRCSGSTAAIAHNKSVSAAQAYQDDLGSDLSECSTPVHFQPASRMAPDLGKESCSSEVDTSSIFGFRSPNTSPLCRRQSSVVVEAFSLNSPGPSAAWDLGGISPAPCVTSEAPRSPTCARYRKQLHCRPESSISPVTYPCLLGTSSHHSPQKSSPTESWDPIGGVTSPQPGDALPCSLSSEGHCTPSVCLTNCQLVEKSLPLVGAATPAAWHDSAASTSPQCGPLSLESAAISLDAIAGDALGVASLPSTVGSSAAQEQLRETLRQTQRTAARNNSKALASRRNRTQFPSVGSNQTASGTLSLATLLRPPDQDVAPVGPTCTHNRLVPKSTTSPPPLQVVLDMPRKGNAAAVSRPSPSLESQESPHRQLDEWEVDLDKPVTTLMIRNLPPHISQIQLIEELRACGFEGTYNFVYVPQQDFTTSENKGFAFVNFLSPSVAGSLVGQWHRQRRFGMNPKKAPLNICAADTQGLEANLRTCARLRRIKNPNFRPFVLKESSKSLD